MRSVALSLEGVQRRAELVSEQGHEGAAVGCGQRCFSLEVEAVDVSGAPPLSGRDLGRDCGELKDGFSIPLGAVWVLVFAFGIGGVACNRGGASPVAEEPLESQASVFEAESAEASSVERPAQASGGFITLPPPRKTGGMPLMEALAARRTNRRIAEKQLTLPTLSGLLWAALGINRPRYNKRTAPTARNFQEIDVYVALSTGLYLYEPEPHRLKQLSSRDIRALTGKQSLVRTAPVDLVYVSDHSRMEDMSAAQKIHYSSTDTGFVSQNVYLYCASEKLATVVIGMVERGPLREAMKLAPHQKIVLTQAVGYPR